MSTLQLRPAGRNILVSLAKAVAFLASLRLLGFAIYTTNNELQLPLVQVTNDPSLYPGDLFVASLDYYASFLWHVLWLPFRWLPEAPLLVALTVLGRLFFLFAAGRLARVLTGRSRTAEIAVWCLFGFGMTPFLGWGTVLPRGFEHTSLATASFLLCLSFLVQGRLVRAGICLGMVGLANIIHGLHGVLMIVPAVVGLSPLRGRPAARAGLIALAVMAPAILLAIRTAVQPHIVDGAFLRLLHFYVPQHWFPSSWRASEWVACALACACVFACCRLPVVPQAARRIVLGLTAGHALLLLAACAAEASGRANLISLQFARSSDLWTPATAIFVTATLVTRMEANLANTRVQMLGAMGLSATLLLWFLRRFLGWFVLLSVPVWLVAAWLARSERPRVAHLAPLLIPTWSIGVFLALGLMSPRPDEVLLQDRTSSELEIARWAERHTSIDATFLVDPGWSAFRMLSRRSSFVTWKEGAGFLWYQPFADEWTTRLRAIGVDPLDPRLSFPGSLQAASLAFSRLDDPSAIRLSRKFGLRYWIVARDKPSSLPTVFENAMGRILALP